MKKIVVMVLVMMLILTAFSSLAEEEITFRGIPWLSSPDEVIEMLKADLEVDELDVSYSIIDNEYATQHSLNPDAYKDSYVGYDGPQIPMLQCKIAIPNLIVAGYTVDGDNAISRKDIAAFILSEYGIDSGTSQAVNVVLYFIPVLNEDYSSYAISENEGQLWRAEYVRLCLPDGITYPQMKNDLYAKLNNLYGQVRRGSITDYTYTGDVWSGKTGEWVFETKSFDYWSGLGVTIDIKDAKFGGYSLDYRCNLNSIKSQIETIYKIKIEEAEKAKQKEIEEKVGSGTGGL